MCGVVLAGCAVARCSRSLLVCGSSHFFRGCSLFAVAACLLRVVVLLVSLSVWIESVNRMHELNQRFESVNRISEANQRIEPMNRISDGESMNRMNESKQ